LTLSYSTFSMMMQCFGAVRCGVSLDQNKVPLIRKQMLPFDKNRLQMSAKFHKKRKRTTKTLI